MFLRTHFQSHQQKVHFVSNQPSRARSKWDLEPNYKGVKWF